MTSGQPLLPRDEAQPPFFVGVDLGGTNTKVGLVDDLGRTLAFTRIPTDAAEGPRAVIRQMGDAIDGATRDARLTRADVVHVGLGTPGTMDIPAGMMLRPHNLPGWRNVPIRDELSRLCGKPVAFDNDANCAALGEYWCGRGRDFGSMILLTLGTGIGAGIITHGGRPITGAHSHAAECGHVIIDYHESGRICPCGQRGHLESYTGAKAVVQRTRETLAAGRSSSIAGRLERGEELTPLLIAGEAENGDAVALEIVLDTARFLAVGIVTLLNTIDPEGVVLGGAMTFGGRDSALGQRFLDGVRDEVRRLSFPVLAEKVVIDFASLGGDAGYIGAAGLARADSRGS